MTTRVSKKGAGSPCTPKKGATRVTPTKAKARHRATLAEAVPAGPKSFIFQCREAARVCYDEPAADHMRACADDLDTAVREFTVAVTPAAMTHLNCMWVRAVKAYTNCHHVTPTPPTSGTMTVDSVAVAA